MRKPVELHIDAAAELEAAVAWYAEKNVHAALRFATETRTLLEIIERAPRSFPSHTHGTRRAVMTSSFPYYVVYVELPDRVCVVAFAHGRRQPGYWSNRV